MATVDTGFASIRRKLNKQKQEYHVAKTHCTFCGKDADNGPLKSCSLCKCVTCVLPYTFIHAKD